MAAEDDDSFMDWETRNEKIPMLAHMVAGKGCLTRAKLAKASSLFAIVILTPICFFCRFQALARASWSTLACFL